MAPFLLDSYRLAAAGGGGSVTYEEFANVEFNSTNHTVDVSGFTISEGDFLLGFDVCDSAGTPPTMTVPSGWTELINVNNNNKVAVIVGWKVAVPADESATSYTFTSSASERGICGIMRFTGVDTSSPIDTHEVDATTDDATPISPALTTTPASSSKVVYGFGCDEHLIALEGSGYPSGMDNNLWVEQAANNQFSSSGSGCAIGGDGLTGSATWTGVLSAAAPWVGITIAIAAA